MRTFTKDEEFINFLKNITLYVTDQPGGTIGALNSDRSLVSDSSNALLYRNLEFLRQRF